jgi:assimilatory nitrate reductase catalytic subunit
LQNGEATNLTPATEYPVNLGMACPKGWEALSVLDSKERATTPLLRDEQGNLKSVGWEPAMQAFVQRFKAIQEKHGSQSVAFLSTGQIPTEEMALLGSLAKFGMGMLHGDGNTRQCMATSVVAYKQAFGFDAPPYSYTDFEESDVIILIGSNLCIAHPIMWERVMRNPHSPEIIVIDPRMTETAMNATQHLAVSPKGDLSLLYGVARILIENGWIDTEFIDRSTNGIDDFINHVKQFTDERVTTDSGLTSDQVHQLAESIHNGKRVSFWWTMGVNQSHQGVRTAQAIINLALLTGNIGRPGTGANSITGQCNAMGSRLFSNTTGLLGGHDFTNEEHRNKIAGVLGIDPSVIPSKNSLPYHQILESILSGKIKGLWVICTNPAHSWINQKHCRDILDRLDFLVVQDMYSTTETARMADLVLPAAGWGEKEGTFINSERRIGLLKKVHKAPGLALSDFSIFKLVAHYWGCGEMFKDWDSPESVFQILKRITKGQPCDITGIEDYRAIDEAGGIQWPAPKIDDADFQLANERRLFEDGKFYHADGRAKFIFENPQPMPERTTDRFPFVLLTGRATASQWHTQTRTRQSAVLRKLYPEKVFVEINPSDANQLAIKPNDQVLVESQRGRIRASAFLTHAVQPGQVFLPMHYEAVNQLTLSTFDPYSHQPAYKACAVRVSRGLN